MGYWTKEKIEEHLIENKYKSISEWRNNSGSSYGAFLKKDKNWQEYIKDKYFTDTRYNYWTKEKIEEHLKENKYESIKEWSVNGGSYAAFKKNVDEDWKEYIKDKYFPNRLKRDYWTKERIEEHLKENNYESISEWRNNNGASYVVFFKYDEDWKNYIKDKYFPDAKKYNNYWNKNNIEKILKENKYESISDWQNNNSASYRAYHNIKDKDWKEYIRNKYFPNAIKPNGYWTKEKIEEHLIENKYKTISDWQNNNSASYRAYHNIKDKDWKEYIKDKYFPDRKNQKGYWTKERIEEHLKENKYKSLKEWRNNSGSSYTTFNRNEDKDWKEYIRNKYFLDRWRKLTKDDVIQYLKDKEFICLNIDDFKNGNSKLKFKCNKDNYVWKTTFNSIKNKKSGCPKCVNNVKKELSPEEIKEIIKLYTVDKLSSLHTILAVWQSV